MKPTRQLKNGFGTVAAVLAVLALTAAPSHAEISAKTDENGEYTGTRIAGSRSQAEPMVWTEANGDAIGYSILNPGGDLNGDLWPVVVESNRAPFHPWVVWSRFTGRSYDLVWSRWSGKHWTMIQPVQDRTRAVDDLDPDLAFGDRGRPFITWWRDDNGLGRVFVSVNLTGKKWLTPSQISMSKIDSRHPTIRIHPGGKITIEYMTPRGLVRQALLFWQPTSITDDIDPHFELHGEAVVIGQPMDGADQD